MEPSGEIRELMLRLEQAMARADASSADEVFSHGDGLTLIGTDPNEWWVGCLGDGHVVIHEPERMDGMRLVCGDPVAYCEGTAGWAADRAHFESPDRDPLPLRLTAVLHREDGAWKVVQLHASLGVADEKWP
jgi:hypothetical protein